ncbi:MAG: aminotransferase class I/II-fold pyridoxal phosphate-dependent enzyme [Clostridia bacterium]|nr:aminotransferase class I/II-fold pyridoxal phosphate-dependent enzyme [Clostridia bacterium]MDY4082797.1 aminotransferase class I/II-fold pyridoxal phosphate-dependent enzyme [Eubacteriales bacterium]
MQALMLAAGMGKRLGKFTGNNTKCMLEVAGKKLVDRAIEAVAKAGIDKFIFVIGYKGDNLRDYILDKYKDSPMEFVFIDNKDYATSNNIYSFYMAKEYLEQDDTIMMESDLIFDSSLIQKLVQSPERDMAVVAKYESWMDGTVVTCDGDDNITQFIEKVDMDLSLTEQYYKTVNVYKFSPQFVTNIYFPFLEAYMKAYGLNSYYETALKVVSHLSKATLKAFYMDDMPWYEIDDAQDLDIATILFSTGKRKYDAIISKFGGYWRYSKMLDFCYLVNPYFPPKKMVEKMQKEFPVLLTQYPSGLNIQNMNAERIFGVDESHILVGNGAAELINVLGMWMKGKVAVGLPTFNEYVRCFRNCELIPIDNSRNDYLHDFDYLTSLCGKVDYICLVSPDNPSGDLLTKEEVEQLCEKAQKLNTGIVIDESFIDFADPDKRYTLLGNDMLNRFDNLIVVKSISKSFGVPALRLGVLASSNAKILSELRSLMQVWNINSFAEYYLQIYNLYAAQYAKACDSIAYERNRFIRELQDVNSIRVYPSQANYLMIDLGNTNSYEFCVRMLNDYNILVKDLSSKNYFKGKNFVRVAIRNEQDNDAMIKAMKEVLL